MTKARTTDCCYANVKVGGKFYLKRNNRVVTATKLTNASARTKSGCIPMLATEQVVSSQVERNIL